MCDWSQMGRLLIDVAQLLIHSIHHLEDGRILKDSVCWHRVTKLESIRISTNTLFDSAFSRSRKVVHRLGIVYISQVESEQ